MAYNMSELDNGTTITDFVGMLNQADNLGGAFPLMIMFTMWIILMIGFKNYDTRVGLIASGTIMSLMGILFWWAGWMSYGYIFIPTATVLLGLIWKALSD